ncbi:MAG: hypothetical protein QGG42_17755 [Phycisphaerae bacterium]|jgi:hypothetical protein|nr:hypothetical protein [Phycisphaerae bacterium]
MTLTSTFGLSSKRLAKLLNAGEPEETIDRQSISDAAAELLRQRLAARLDFDKNCVDSLPAILNRTCPELQPVADCSVGEALFDPAAPLDILDTLRQYGKGLSRQWDEGPEHAVAVAIYFAAIAAALVSHGCKITTRSYPDLAGALQMLLDGGWITPELTKLFNSAREICGMNPGTP